MSRTILGMLIGMLVIAGVFVAANGDGNHYAEERTQQVQAQEAERTARTAIVEAERTERQAIAAQTQQVLAAQEAATMRLFLLVLLACVVLVVGAGVVVFVARISAAHPRQPQPAAPATIVLLSQQLPGYRPSIIDGRWVLESDHDYLSIDSARRLIEQRR